MSADIFQTNFFSKIYFRILSECQIVLIQIRANRKFCRARSGYKLSAKVISR